MGIELTWRTVDESKLIPVDPQQPLDESLLQEYELLEVADIRGEPDKPVGVGLLWERWKDAGILET